MPTAQSNVEKYLAVIAGHDEEIPTQPASRVEWYLNEILQNGGGGGGGGTTNYSALSNKPRINGTELTGNKTAENLDLVPSTRTVNGKPLSENVTLDKSDVGLDNVENTSDADKPVSNPVQAALNLKVDKVAGKDLSTEDFTSEEKLKLSGIETGATVTVIDKTLSNSGEAADANAVGNVIAGLRSENALLRELLNGVDAPIYRKASGNPAIFADGYANAALKSCVVTITPTQDGTPSASNPVPISGYSGVTVQRTGKNMARIAKIKTNAKFNSSGMTATLNADGSVSISGTASDEGSASTDAAVVLCDNTSLSNGVFYPVGKYVLSSNIPEYDASSGRNRVRVAAPRAGGSVTWSAAYSPGEEALVSVGVLKTGIYLDVILENGYVADNLNLQVMFRPEGLGDASWVPYDGQSVNIPFVDADNGGASLTVYGGILDAISGTLTVTHDCIESYDGETVPDGWISSTGELSTGAQVVYPLTTPVTYQLSPVSLTSLSGDNCCAADAGTLSVAYRADTSISFGG